MNHPLITQRRGMQQGKVRSVYALVLIVHSNGYGHGASFNACHNGTLNKGKLHSPGLEQH